MRLLLASVLLLGTTACSSGGESPRAGSEDSSSSSTSPTPAPTPAPSLSPAPDVSGTRACAEVRAGINAFNAHDYRSTVAHFRLALPLARSQAEATPSEAAEDLVEAVGYYARLAPPDYPESARSSEDFATYKTITLAQCVTVGRPLTDAPSASPGVTT
jgi:hypothetical protein